jgi:hypothetical protein
MLEPAGEANLAIARYRGWQPRVPVETDISESFSAGKETYGDTGARLGVHETLARFVRNTNVLCPGCHDTINLHFDQREALREIYSFVDAEFDAAN